LAERLVAAPPRGQESCSSQSDERLQVLRSYSTNEPSQVSIIPGRIIVGKGRLFLNKPNHLPDHVLAEAQANHDFLRRHSALRLMIRACELGDAVKKSRQS